MSRASKRAARQDERMYRHLMFIIGPVAAACIAAPFLRGTVADGLDAILSLDASRSPRNAALLGWAVAFSLPTYGLVLSLVKNPFTVFRRTWPLAAALIVPTGAFLPGRATTNRTDDIEAEFYFLGSFFDTYYLGIAAFASIGVAGLIAVYLAPRTNYDAEIEPDVLADLRAGASANLFPVYTQNRLDRIKESPATQWLRRMLVRTVTACWVIGVFIYALTF